MCFLIQRILTGFCLDLQPSILNLCCCPDLGKLGFSSSNSREVEVLLIILIWIWGLLQFPVLVTASKFPGVGKKTLRESLALVSLGVSGSFLMAGFSYRRRTSWCRQAKNIYARTSLKMVWGTKVFISLTPFPSSIIKHTILVHTGNVRILGPCLARWTSL